MKFKNFKRMLQENFEKMTRGVTQLFEVEVDKDELWDLYLDSFPAGTNEVFRERREYDCSCCKQFIRNIGNVVVIKDNKMETVWDIDTDCTTFKPVAKALSDYIKSHAVTNIYVNKIGNKIGTDKNFERTASKVYEWEHLYLEVPNRFVDRSSKSIGDIQGTYRDIRNVFKRSLDEITEESVTTILDLIKENTLYKGEEWKFVLTEFLNYKREYDRLPENEKDNYAWGKSIIAGGSIGKIRNHSIGTLLVNISEGMDLDLAVKKYEFIVAPSNYKRPKAIYTQKMLEDAKKFIVELGYMESLGRRFAKLDDITINNILFANRDSAKKMGALDVFEEMSKAIAVDTRKYEKVEEIGIVDFVNGILPTAREVEVLFENKHAGNLVSLIAPENKDAKTMFKWDNNFGWAYTGNITDSLMKENVQKAGGKVDGDLRFSIQWNDIEEDRNDLDAHCIEPRGNHISYMHDYNHRTTGILDVDIRLPKAGISAVENITWSDRSKMEEGVYTFYVHNFKDNGGKSGFRAEIEVAGKIYSFTYNKPLKEKERIKVAEVTFSKKNGFTVKELLPATTSSREVWGLNTNQFVPVSVIMNSPNYWNEQDGIGHKHYFFMLKDCINSESPNGFYNEFLKNELNEHRKVFEALGSKMAVKDVENQLSGIGFSSTKRNDLVVKVKGATEKVFKIKF